MGQGTGGRRGTGGKFGTGGVSAGPREVPCRACVAVTPARLAEGTQQEGPGGPGPARGVGVCPRVCVCWRGAGAEGWDQCAPFPSPLSSEAPLFTPFAL